MFVQRENHKPLFYLGKESSQSLRTSTSFGFSMAGGLQWEQNGSLFLSLSFFFFSSKKSKNRERLRGLDGVVASIKTKVSFTIKGQRPLWSEYPELVPKNGSTFPRVSGQDHFRRKTENELVAPSSFTYKGKTQKQFSFFIGVLDLICSLGSSQYGLAFRCFDKCTTNSEQALCVPPTESIFKRQKLVNGERTASLYWETPTVKDF
jgi:hypothetical protein